jgi:hypothetical protein
MLLCDSGNSVHFYGWVGTSYNDNGGLTIGDEGGCMEYVQTGKILL